MTESQTRPGDILVPDTEPPDRSHDNAFADTSLRRIAARVPSDLALTARLAWHIDPRTLLVMTAAQLGAAAATAFGLLATTDVLTPLLALNDRAWETTVRAAAPALTLLVAAASVHAILQAVISAASARLGPRVDSHAAARLLDTVTRADLVAYDDPTWADAKRAAEDGADRGHRLLEAAMHTSAAALQVVAAAGVLATLHPILLPLLLLAVLPHAAASVVAARIQHRSARKLLADRRWRYVLMGDLTYKDSAPEVRVHRMRGYLLDRYRKVSDRIEHEAARAGRSTALVRLAGQAVAGLGTGAVYATLIYLTARGTLPAATAAGAAVAIRTATMALTDAVHACGELFEHGLYVGDWARFTTGAGAGDEAPVRGAGQLPAEWTAVHLDDVTFTYPGAKRPALDRVTLTLRRGETIAFVGENGSGKTTLARVIAGLYLPQSGRVRWSGPTGELDLADADPESLWEHVTLVPQDAYDWPFLVRDTITLGIPHQRGDDAIHDAARASGADAVIAALPHGLDTSLARSWWGGHDLSGGQWQRLAIARAFHRDTALLIMDEPTSALDARAEHTVFRSLLKLADDRTTVFITHRLANARVADRVLVMHDGRIVQDDTYDALVRQDGLFAELHRLQQT
ncbi:ABC transporter ATP-binding protein [Embleya sp. NPDC050493]|uniref:ABC transporter ATP-binding protein n=1 Tax=Embleya sp. NPDC050493 TaxID=3363989 RepID=UPI0037B0BC86